MACVLMLCWPTWVFPLLSSTTLLGSLTRAGGFIAQLAATKPELSLTVTPVDRVDLAATERDLVPINGGPRL